MFGNLGFPELLILFILILVLFGGSRLPALGKGMGEAIRHFRSGLRGNDEAEPSEKEKPKDG